MMDFATDMERLMRKLDERAEKYQEVNNVYEELENIPSMVLGLEDIIGTDEAEEINKIIYKALDRIEEERDRWSN